MAIIYTYGFDNNVQGNDAWIGTNADNRKTKQFTVSSVANYLNTAGVISIGGQLTFKFVTSGATNGTISFIGGGGAGTSFADITSLYVSTTDVSGANVTEWLNYLIGSQLLIVEQNTPNKFGHYVINSYAVTGNPNFYNLGLGYIGGNGVLVSDAYYDLVALNIPDGTGSGVDTITTTDSTFISSTPNIPTAGNVTVTSSLSATGTPDNTTYLRGDNTWASIPPGLAGSGTTNYVAKWSATDTLTDSVIYDNGTNVGIGTTSPSYKLDVSGTGTVISRVISTDGNTARFDLHSSPNSRYSLSCLASNSFLLFDEIQGHAAVRYYGGASGSWVFRTNNLERLKIDSSGNVGIGTTSPLSLLNVLGGNTAAVEYITIGNQAAYHWGAGYNSAGNTDAFVSNNYNSDSARFDIRMKGTALTDAKVTVLGSGNVGIGTTSPAYKLEVNGTTRLNGRLTLGGNVNNFIEGSAGGLQLNSISDFNFVRAANTFVTIKNTGDVGIGTTSPDSKLQVLGQVKIGSSNSTTYSLRFEREVLGVSQDSHFYSPSNNSPSSFFIEGGYWTAENTGVVTAANNGYAYYERYFGNGTNLSFKHLGFVNRSASAFTGTDLVSSIAMLASGNVGIGTTTPSQKLHVVGSTYSTGGFFTPNSATGYFTNLSSTAGMLLSSLNAVELVSGGNSTMFLNPSGNVGIGTTSPIVPLHVIGDTVIEDTSAVLTLKSTQVGSTSSIQFESLSNAAIIGGGTADYLSFMTASNHRMRILANGRVGIGTTSPTQSLHVNGSVRITGVIYDSSNSAGTAGQVLSKPTNDTIAWVNKDSITSIPTSITATPGGSLSLASNIDFVYFTWSGGSGTYTLNLPVASTHAYKIIRFVCDSTITASDKIHIQGSLGDTVDGSLFYELNKPYNGVQVWSDGSEWIVIQAKAT